MKKILMRAAMSPFERISSTKILAQNLIGNNIGNMVFQNSVCRAVMTEDTSIDTINTSRAVPDETIRQINENYDILLLPFANAFRKSFLRELRNVTYLVRKLTIPAVVVGVGAQAELDGKFSCNEEQRESIREFMEAILEKSAIVGVRGEFTADVLGELGFQAEKDFTVIGCPSMFLYGGKLPRQKPLSLTPASKVVINSKISLPQNFHDFMYRSVQLLPDYQYIPQVLEELRAMYIGMPIEYNNRVYPRYFPADFTSGVYQSGRGTGFLNYPCWIEFLRTRDFSFGSRIHGNIAAIQAGIPCYVIISDMRIKELADYHNIPSCMITDIREDTDIFGLAERADFQRIQEGHDKRFQHYLDFLHKNGLETVFDGGMVDRITDGKTVDGEAVGKEDKRKTKYDRMIQDIPFLPGIQPFCRLDAAGQLERLQEWHEYQQKKGRSTALKEKR